MSKKGYKQTKEHKRKISINNARYWLNKKRPEITGKNSPTKRLEVREKIRNSRINKSYEEFYGKEKAKKIKEKMSLVKRGKKRSREASKKSSKTMKRLFKEEKLKPNLWNKGLTKEIDERVRKNGENISRKIRELRKNPEYAKKIIKNMLKGLLKRPTSFEQKICDLCLKYHLPFIYSGDGSFLINFKNPDFVNEKDKIVIEVFYSWFKIRDYGSVENYKEFCRRKYNSKGWKVIFIDEIDLSHENWEEICLKKIKNYL